MPISYGQIYPILKKLAGEGLIIGKLEAGGRERQRYSITAAGKKLLRAWLIGADSGASRSGGVSHRELLLKLFFTSPDELGAMRGPIESFRREEEQRLEHYRRTRSWLRSEHGENPRLGIWEMVLATAWDRARRGRSGPKRHWRPWATREGQDARRARRAQGSLRQQGKNLPRAF